MICIIWLGSSGCTQIVTAPISVVGAVAETGIGIVGAAGGALADTVGGGKDGED